MIMSIKSPINKYKAYWQLVRVVYLARVCMGLKCMFLFVSLIWFYFYRGSLGLCGQCHRCFLYFYLFYQVLVAGLRSNSRFVCTSVSPSFFAGLSNGGEYRCGDWTVAVKRYSASVFKSRRHFVSDGYHFFRICQRKRSRYLKTQIKPRLELACRQALVLVLLLKLFWHSAKSC